MPLCDIHSYTCALSRNHLLEYTHMHIYNIVSDRMASIHTRYVDSHGVHIFYTTKYSTSNKTRMIKLKV